MRAATPQTTAFSRRSFLRLVLAAGIAPQFIPARLLGAGAPSRTLRIGFIGVGRMGQQDLRAAMTAGAKTGARVVALCDVENARLEEARSLAAKHHAIVHPDQPFEMKLHRDYRELLARKDIDGVFICTPDHWHALGAVHAAEAGKGIYVEKPMTYSIAEGQALVKAVRKNKVVLQVGSQQRSSIHFHRTCWLVRNGRIGKLKEIVVELPVDSGTGNKTPMPIPKTLNYDAWLGPSPEVPFTQDRVYLVKGRPGWMQIQAYTNGMIANWGTHMFDIAQWGLGCDLDGGPVEVCAQGEFPDRGLFDVHTHFTGEALYANGVVLRSRTLNAAFDSQDVSANVRFIGENGWIRVKRGDFSASDPQILKQKPDGGLVLPTSNNHIGNFFESLREGKDPVAPVEAGHRSNTLCILHHLSMKLGGRKLHWDPASETIRDVPEAARMMDYDHRSGYELPG